MKRKTCIYVGIQCKVIAFEMLIVITRMSELTHSLPHVFTIRFALFFLCTEHS